MLLRTTQTTILSNCLLLTGLIAVYQVSAGSRPVGQFATLVAYMTQLQRSLTFFGKFYLLIQSGLIDAERMLQLLEKQLMVLDRSHATDMGKCEGGIKFQDVEFSYDARKPILRGLTFECPPGSTTALVGDSGGGKSTVLQLICRFHNPPRVTFSSAATAHIGIVPQAPALFHETLMYNLEYANLDAKDSEVYNACCAAGINDQIVTWPDGYNTNVGDKGSLFSGGEKQRVALAQTILKDTKFILIDEATAALDTGTERRVMKSLKQFTTIRTILIVCPSTQHYHRRRHHHGHPWRCSWGKWNSSRAFDEQKPLYQPMVSQSMILPNHEYSVGCRPTAMTEKCNGLYVVMTVVFE
ncbi:ABC transporter aclQ [Penicillium herquei]|nr:ABC transporter aclQ [Penicillium herquei]